MEGYFDMIRNYAAMLYNKSVYDYNKKSTPTKEVKGGFFNKPAMGNKELDMNEPINRVNQYFNSIREKRVNLNGKA